MKSRIFDDDSEDDYLSFYYDEEAKKTLPRFNLAKVQLENLTEWLRPEYDDRPSPLYTLERLVIDDGIEPVHEIYDRTGHYGPYHRKHEIE
ncbi:MAG: hypothetical protein PQJ59_11095 [Spirochaetales bacterium]|nr:hypothetical protein [Spirochaetales bacterium]